MQTLGLYIFIESTDLYNSAWFSPNLDNLMREAWLNTEAANHMPENTVSEIALLLVLIFQSQWCVFLSVWERLRVHVILIAAACLRGGSFLTRFLCCRSTLCVSDYLSSQALSLGLFPNLASAVAFPRAPTVSSQPRPPYCLSHLYFSFCPSLRVCESRSKGDIRLSSMIICLICLVCVFFRHACFSWRRSTTEQPVEVFMNFLPGLAAASICKTWTNQRQRLHRWWQVWSGFT